MNTHQQLETLFAFFCHDQNPLSVAHFERFGLQGKLKHYQKGALLMTQGNPAPNVFFITQGHVRYFNVSAEGKEFTQSFASAPSIAGSTRAMTQNTPALFNIEALDDVICLEFEWRRFFNTMKIQPGFLEAYTQLLETLFIKKEEREYAFVQHSAEQRYLDFIDRNPALCNQVPLKMIASHIGITPIALSRIRRRLGV
ncbi:Crp/Fnr family transcriptional regulator [Pseudoalteromonas sp. SMS1]|uniref:Crp/Fnr family transcriptional regulator n=1 Tax=Pseudoalteromonas sp. SMS1 TaxID=2908894 RepID=UPI001F203660|nr:Crp/Fnr family transcriptional regulator [Pseudoalteromonas sp. SMS1]MCF2856842.1 Crp/Fnr family transcriptional regulator [Pseudoalteromonas sp. SMS1]